MRVSSVDWRKEGVLVLAVLSITSLGAARAQSPENYVPMDAIPAVIEELPNPCDNPSTREWGPDDQRGNLNYLTPERVAENLSLIQLGKVYSLAHLLEPGKMG